MEQSKKKKIYIIVVALLIIGATFIFFNLPKRTKYFYIEEGVEKESFKDIEFFVDLDDNQQRIFIEFEGVNDRYTGYLFIPGSYDGILKLKWNDDQTKIKSFLFNYNSGELSIDGKKTVFFINNNGKRTDFMFTVIRTSKDIEPLFINIDENLGTIDAMNSDYIHETSCYGQALFNDNNYFMSIKGRGNSTWRDGVKKPYNITFLDSDYDKKQSVSMIEGVEAKKWSLLANYMDISLLRNRIGYELANKLSIGLASDYFDVWMNGKYLGNYLITPKNDYKATENGFILEIDNTIDEEDPQFVLKENGKEVDTLRFTVKNNDAGLPVKDIQSYMQKAWNAIRDYDSDEYMNYIDVESWAKMYLLHELFKNRDVVSGSIFMHKDSQSDNDKLIAGPIWDLDRSLGQLTYDPNLGLEEDVIYSGGGWYINSIKLINGNYSFLQELSKHKNFIEKVKEIYNDNKDLFNDLENQIDINVEEAYDSFLADYIKWGNDRTYSVFYTFDDWNYGGDYPINYQSTNSYDDYLENLKKYVNVRVKFLNENIIDIK